MFAGVSASLPWISVPIHHFWTDCFSCHNLVILCELLEIITNLIKSDIFGSHWAVLPRYFCIPALSHVGCVLIITCISSLTCIFPPKSCYLDE